MRLGLVADELLVGLRGREDRIEVLVAGGVDQAGEIEFDHRLVHLVGELFEREHCDSGAGKRWTSSGSASSSEASES